MSNMDLRLSCVVLVLAIAVQQSYGQDGYATQGGGTTGGNGGQVVVATNEAELRNYAKDSAKRVIKIDRMIQLSNNIVVGPNKSILGSKKGAGVTGAGFHIWFAKNVIIRGLIISKAVAPRDGVLIEGSTNVWIDHNDFFSNFNAGKDYYDGLCDINSGSDWITVSWNRFHDHHKVSLVGHSDANGGQDKGKLHVTYHHNYFYNTGSRLPSVRFGTVHVYSNVYETAAESGIHARMGAQLLVEGNVFTNVRHPMVTSGDSNTDGFMVAKNNNIAASGVKAGSFTNPPYKYSVDSLGSVANNVKRGAGQTMTF